MTKQELKDSIASVVKANGENEITGANLQEKLFEIIDETYNTKLFPNGVKLVTESRDLQADDAGYILVLSGGTPETPTILTIPEISPLQIGDNFGIEVVDYPDGVNNSFEIYGTFIKPMLNELVLFSTFDFFGTISTVPLSTSINDNEGNSLGKTALRYLMDNVGALYPNGVEVVTATRDFQDSDIGKFLFLADGVGLTMPTSAPFYPNNKLIGIFAGATNYPCDNFYEVVPGKKVYLYGTGYEVQTGNESLTLITGSNFDNSQQTVGLVNGTPVFVNESDTVGYTATRYLMDNVGGGGSPGGSDNQIQINQSGAFFADSTFQKSDADFNVGFNHTQQSAVTFTGSGLDDLTVSGTFSGAVPTTYTVTIDGLNQKFLQVDTSTISGGSFAVGNTITGGSGGSATVLSISNIVYPTLGVDAVYLRVTVTSPFTNNEALDNGLGVSGTLSGNVDTDDTVEWTDGVITETNYPITEPILLLNNGIIAPMSNTSHTLSDSWTWTYSKVNQNVLDFSNNDYKFQSTFGTDTFGYQIGDNLLGFGIKGSLNSYSNPGGDFAISGIFFQGTELAIGNSLQFSTGEVNEFNIKQNQGNFSISNGLGESTELNQTANTFYLKSTLSLPGEYGISQSAGVVSLGNISGGNNTKITIDDVNEQITISNLSAYDDDTAAGVGGLTAGMVYMTTGSGSAPLNAAGILMIKQ